jgi:CHAT domain-containing protein/tetratricopeptide (TPR) repeat protein
MPRDAFSQLIAEVRQGAIDLDTARLRAAALPKTDDLLHCAFDALAEIDRAKSLEFRGDLAAAELCVAAVAGHEDSEFEVLSAHTLGRLHLQSGNTEAAYRHVDRAERLCRERADRGKLSAVLGTRGGLYLLTGDHAKALEAYDESYRLALEFENRASAASSAFGKARALAELGRTKEALIAYQKARSLFQGAGEAFWEFQALKEVADLVGEEAEGGTLEDAVSLGLSVDASAEQLIPLLVKLSHSHDRQGRTAEAERDIVSALDMAKKAGRQELESILLGNRGANLAQLGRDTEATRWLDRALRFAVEIGDTEGAEVAAKNLQAIYLKNSARRLVGQEPAPPQSVVDQSAPLADQGTAPPSEPPEQAELPYIARPDAGTGAIQRIALGILRSMPDRHEADVYARRIGKVSAVLALYELVEDPTALMQEVGDDKVLRHFLAEVLDSFAFQKIAIAPAYRSALEAALATPFSDSDCDRAVRDIESRVERGLSSQRESSDPLRNLQPGDLPRIACHQVAERILAKAQAAEDAQPERALLYALALCRWLPQYSPSGDRFQAAQLLGTLSQGFKAFDLSEQAWQMAAMSASEGDARTGVAGALTNLGTLFRRTGRAVEARAAYEAAIEAVKALSDQPIVLAMTLMNAATAYSDLGEHTLARAACERAIGLIPVTSEHAQSLIIAHTNLGAALLALGDEAGNEQETLTALTLARRHKVRNQEAVALGHLGQIARRRGRVDDAIESFETAARIATEDGDRWNAQNFLRDLAGCLSSLGLDSSAISHFERALDLARKVGDQRSQALCLLGLGRARDAKDIEKAREELTAALEIFRRVANASLAQRAAIALAQLAVQEAVGVAEAKSWEEDLAADWSMGPGSLRQPAALRKARALMQEAEEMSEGIDPDVASGLMSLRARILLLEGDSRTAIALMKQLAVGEKEPIEAFRAAFSLARALHRVEADAAGALPWYQRALDKYESVIAQVPGSGARSELRSHFAAVAHDAVFCALAVDDLDSAFDICERARSGELRRLQALRGRPVAVLSLTDVRRRLAPGTVLVELLPTVQGTVVIMVSPECGPPTRSLVVPGCGQMEFGRAWVAERQAYERASSPASAFDPGIGDAWRAKVADFCSGLGRQLMGPVAAALGDYAKTVILVPHSILLCFPLHAVRLGDGHWSDRFDIAFLASASALATASEGLGTRPGSETFLGVADSLQDLRMAEIETRRAARRFGDRAVVATGRAATRLAFAASAGTADMIHIACHARQSLGAEEETAIYLWSKAKDGVEMLDLASLNRDFVLKPGARVVLSACESGTAMPDLGGEVVSLAGGLITSGAAAVVSSFWRVGDAASALLFERYYENVLNRGMSASAALGEAQRSLRSMTEAEVHARLASIIAESGLAEDPSYAAILAAFLARRNDVRPFDDTADWAAFFLMGAA